MIHVLGDELIHLLIYKYLRTYYPNYHYNLGNVSVKATKYYLKHELVNIKSGLEYFKRWYNL